MDRNELPLEPPHLGVSSGVPKAIFEPIARLAQTVHQMDLKELLLDPHHVGVQLAASKLISKPMVRLAQTVHLSCVEINKTSKQTEKSFHLTHVT
jgi:hypothetical protein